MTLRRYLALALLALAMFLPGQAALPPLDRDESRYAQATTQMLETGEPIDIRYQEQPRYLQPAGIYWLQAASVTLLSSLEAREIWAYRVPSLIGAVASVLLTAWIGAMLFGAEAGLIAGLLMAASLILGVEARMAKIDALLLAVTLVAQGLLIRAYLGRDGVRRPPWGEALGFWAALGVGLMLKGPIILLVVGGTIALLAAVERRGRWLGRLRPLVGVPLMLAIFLPWAIAIFIQSAGKFFADSVGHNLLGKVTTGQQSHGAPPGYYLALFPVTFWPGSLFAILAVPFAWVNRRTPAVRFCLCWIAPTWVVYELVATKLPHYTIPTYPAIACLTGAALAGVADLVRRSRWGRIAVWPAGILFAGVTLVLALGLPGLLWRLTGHLSPWGTAASAVALVLAGFALRELTARDRGDGQGDDRSFRAVALAVGAALAIFPTAYQIVLPAVEPAWLSPRIAALVKTARPCPETVLATAPYTEPSLVFLVGTKTRLVGPEGAAQHLVGDPKCGLALVGAAERERFTAALGGLAVRPVGELSGINYSNGKRLTLTLYRAG